jgi:hypothetical protein
MTNTDSNPKTDFVRLTNELRYPRGFMYGELIKVHVIGLYQIVEYHPTVSNTNGRLIDTSEVLFHPFVNGEDFMHSYNTLDRALIGAIANAHEAGMADDWIFRMLRM